MLKSRWYMILLSMLAVAFFAGCSDDDDSGTDPTGGLTSEQQFTAVANEVIAYINTDAPGVVLASTLNGDMDTYTVVDIRAEGDYNDGHIAGAIHSTLGTVKAKVAAGTIPTSKPIVVACYTGQSAGHAVVALRAMGHTAYILKWGMSSWNTTLASKWTDSTGDGCPAGNIETTANALTTEYAFPTMDTGATTEGEAIDARIDAMLAGGFKGISIADMVANGLDTYFILNYFENEHYMPGGSAGVPGHLTGAFQFEPKASLGIDQQLKYLPTDKPIVVYCWTGQTASQVTAYLNMLGYEAYDLKFSSNALWYSSLVGHKWSEATLSNDFPLATN